MGRLILVRHGESESNVTRVFAINPEATPLTELGYRQAREAAQTIATEFCAERVVSSAYLRARETARVIAATLGVPLDVESNLNERDIGALQGCSYDSVLSAPGYDRTRPWAWKPDGGESFEDVRARAAPVLDRLAEGHRDRDLVVVSHGGVMMALWAHVTREWRGTHTVPNCGIVMIEHGSAGYSPPREIGAAGSVSQVVG
jgi:probable phosphoglycerate mutase